GRFFFGRLGCGLFNRGLGGLGLRLIGFGVVRLDSVDFRARSRLDVLRRRIGHVRGELFCFGRSLRQGLVGVSGRLFGHFLTLDGAQACLGLVFYLGLVNLRRLSFGLVGLLGFCGQPIGDRFRLVGGFYL